MSQKISQDSNLMHKYMKYSNILAGTGAVCGAVYGFRHPSEKTCIDISKKGLSSVDVFEKYKSCFNLEEAEKALSDKKLSQDEYSATEKIVNSLQNVIDKEKTVKDISETPYAERKQTFKEAVAKADAARRDFNKTLLTDFNKNLQNKLSEYNIFDKNKLEEVVKEAGKNGLSNLKELLKGSAKCATIGAALGLALSGVLISLSKSLAKHSDK